MIESNIIQRTFNVKYANKCGTGFTLEHNSKQYLVTCKHIFPFVMKNDKITFYINQNNVWNEINGICIFDESSFADILLIKLENDISHRHEVYFGEGNPFFVGETAYFLGFPYGKYTEDTNEINNTYPFPFAKSGIISTPLFKEDGISKIYLDGINNVGFSGGPVFTTGINKNNTNIIGVVKGYLPDENEIKTPLGKVTFEYNSGIVEVHSIMHIVEIFNKI